jgi:addiction module HigA family antidote
VLREDYLKPLGMGVYALAKRLNVPPSRINDIVLERRGVSTDTTLRLTRCFGGDAQMCLNLQAIYDLRVAERKPLQAIRRASWSRGTERTPRCLLASASPWEKRGKAK